MQSKHGDVGNVTNQPNMSLSRETGQRLKDEGRTSHRILFWRRRQVQRNKILRISAQRGFCPSPCAHRRFSPSIMHMTHHEDLHRDFQWNRFYDGLMSFWHAVHWSEPWIIALGVFHVLLLILAVTTRKHSNFQIGLFVFIMLGVYAAEPLNAVMVRWKA
jgi:hypothetical protein